MKLTNTVPLKETQAFPCSVLSARFIVVGVRGKFVAEVPTFSDFSLMGWKASTIFIRPKVTISGKEIFEGLGFCNVTDSDPEPFEIAQYPTDGRYFVGEYNGCTILSGDLLTTDLFASVGSEYEKKLVAMFPDVEVCAVDLHSSTNMWGYIVFQNGKRVRERLGDYSGTMWDNGDPVEEEKYLLSCSQVGPDGKRTYRLREDQEKPYSEDQVGENFVFEMYRRYTGDSLNNMSDELFNHMFDGFNLELPKFDLQAKIQEMQKEQLIQQQSRQQIPQTAQNSERKQWWKFWQQ